MTYFQCRIEESGYAGTGNLLKVRQVCDGALDCIDGEDEKNCPGRYYCMDTPAEGNGTSFWIDAGLVCNMHKDCPLGDDECQDCLRNGTEIGYGVSSDAQMIQQTWIKTLIVVECILILVLNSIAAWDISTKNTETNSGKIDRLAILSLCAYDTLMGVYLGYIFTVSTIISSKYCLMDYQWRSGWQCRIQGVMFTLSAHGSLLMISMISLTRYAKCVLGREISLKMATLVLSLLHLINIAHSVLPIIPISSVQDVFRAYMSFNKNPFFKEYQAEELLRKYQLYFNTNTTHSTYTMLEQLNKVYFI